MAQFTQLPLYLETPQEQHPQADNIYSTEQAEQPPHAAHGHDNRTPTKRKSRNPFPNATKLVEREIRRLSFEANIYERGLGDYPLAKTNYEKREQLRQELALLSPNHNPPADTGG